MFKKTVCLTLTAAMLLISGCAGSDEPAGVKMKTLAEIRAEKENASELAKKYENLDISKAYFYVPDVDSIENISIVLDASIEEKEKVILETANLMMPGSSDENDIVYYFLDSEYNPRYISYSDCKNDPQRADYLNLICMNNKLTLSMNIPGNWLSFGNSAVDDLVSTSKSTPRFINHQDPVEEYNLLTGDVPDVRVELQDSEILLSDAVEVLQSNFENSPLNVGELKLKPQKTGVYNVGERYGVCTWFVQEYNGVLLDYHHYGYNIETGEDEKEKRYLSFRMAMVWENQTDQLFGAKIITGVKPSGDSFEKFVSLESFLSTMSEKLTGRSRFSIDTVELLYEVDRIYPENYKELLDEGETIFPITSYSCHPMWVAYTSNSRIVDTPQMCVTMDAVTGEFNLYRSFLV